MLGYVWVDIFTPQLISYGLLSSIPVSLLLGIMIALSLLRLPPSPDVRLRVVTILVVVFSIWMTISLSWAVVPDAAYVKWNWAIKSVAFSCLLPLFFRNRVQIESLVWIFVLSGMGHCMPFAAKVLLSGGGYGSALGLVGGNNGYGESSFLSLFAVSLVPMCLYLRSHSVLFPRDRLIGFVLFGFIACAVLTALGTYARTGLISLGTLAVFLFFFSARKWIIVLLVCIFSLGVGVFMGEGWSNRMSTIADSGTESSAMTRVGVWRWTLGYVTQSPLGGSFDVYQINRIDQVMADGTVLQVAGRAFHSIYFEVLGELGIPGFLIYLAIIATTIQTLINVRRKSSVLEMSWLRDLCNTFIICAFVFLAGGTFIGVGFNSYFYYIAGVAASLANIFDRCNRERGDG